MANESLFLENYASFEVLEQGLVAIANFIDPPNAIDYVGILEELKILISRQNYSYGVVDDNELVAILDRWHCAMNDVVVARGIPSGEPIDDSLEFYFETNRVPSPQLLSNGHVDFRELGILQNVQSGQVLVRKIPGQFGIAGLDVYGNAIQSKTPKPKSLPMGSGTSVSNDGLSLVSDVGGQIVYLSDQLVSVVSIHHVNGDVDFSTGNINFLGSVIVQGSVREGFTIKAAGNIEIFGSVERANLRADGDIIIHGGVQGSAKTEIYAKGSIRTLYLQNSNVRAENDVIVADSVMHSIVRAQTLRVIGKHGVLVGGLTRMDHSVFARSVGTHLGTATRIEFVVNLENDEKYYSACSRIASFEATLLKTGETLEKLLLMEKRLGNLSNGQAAIKERLFATETSVREQLARAQSDRENLELIVRERKPVMVEVTTAIYPEVHVIREKLEWHCNDVISGCKLVCDEDGWHRS